MQNLSNRTYQHGKEALLQVLVKAFFQVHLYSIRNFFVRKATMDQSVLALAKRIVSADYAAQHSMPP